MLLDLILERQLSVLKCMVGVVREVLFGRIWLLLDHPFEACEYPLTPRRHL